MEFLEADCDFGGEEGTGAGAVDDDVGRLVGFEQGLVDGDGVILSTYKVAGPLKTG